MARLSQPEHRARKRELEKVWARKRRTTMHYRLRYQMWYAKKKKDPKYRANVQRLNRLKSSHTRGCSESLVTLFSLIPPDQKLALALDVLSLSSAHSLLWINPELDDLICEYTEESA